GLHRATCRSHWSALPRMGAAEDAVRGNVSPLVVDGERPNLVPSVRNRRQQPLHPLRVPLEGLDTLERTRLGREGRVFVAVGPAPLPALARLAGVEELPRGVLDRAHRVSFRYRP